MNGRDEHGRAGPAAEISTETEDRGHSTERYGATWPAATPTPIAQSRFFSTVVGLAAPRSSFDWRAGFAAFRRLLAKIGEE
jgi:hypothetical protein